MEMKHFSWWASDVTGNLAQKLVDTGLFEGADQAQSLGNAITFLNACTVSILIVVLSLLAGTAWPLGCLGWGGWWGRGDGVGWAGGTS